jgi:hypothetical protein
MTIPRSLPNRVRLSALVLLVGVLASGGCRRHVIAGGLSDSTFVAAIAGLRRLPAQSMVDSASRSRARDSVLKHYGVTAAQLESAAAALANSPDRAAGLWAEITKKENMPRQ